MRSFVMMKTYSFGVFTHCSALTTQTYTNGMQTEPLRRSRLAGWTGSWQNPSLLVQRFLLATIDHCDEAFDTEVDEGQEFSVFEAVDPDDGVLAIHFEGRRRRGRHCRRRRTSAETGEVSGRQFQSGHGGPGIRDWEIKTD